MSWLKWDQARKEKSSLRGVWTSKEGTEKLSAKKVELHPERDSGQLWSTRVLHNGKTIGKIVHPKSGSNATASFNPIGIKVGMTRDAGPAPMYMSKGLQTTHDAAVESILRHHNIDPPKVSSATKIAERSTGPFSQSVIHGPHEGRREAPRKGMSETAKNADSVATRIRMNAARHDPITGQKLTTDTRSADKLAAKIDKPLSFARIKKIYGEKMRVHRASGRDHSVLDKHMTNLAEIPESHHRLLAEHFNNGMSDKSGIFMSSGRAVDTPGSAARDTHERGEAISGDRPNERQGGMYWWNHRQLHLPEDTHSGSVSTAAHESGHAMDHALGLALSNGTRMRASELPHFQQVYGEVTHSYDDSDVAMHPYYLGKVPGQNGSGPREMFAESYGAWAKGRQMFDNQRDRDLFTGYALGVDPNERRRAGRVLNQYHETNHSKIKEMMSE